MSGCTGTDRLLLRGKYSLNKVYPYISHLQHWETICFLFSHPLFFLHTHNNPLTGYFSLACNSRSLLTSCYQPSADSLALITLICLDGHVFCWTLFALHTSTYSFASSVFLSIVDVMSVIRCPSPVQIRFQGSSAETRSTCSCSLQDAATARFYALNEGGWVLRKWPQDMKMFARSS